MRRREFLRQTFFLPVAGATIAVLVTSCSDDSSSDSADGSDTITDGTTTTDGGTSAATCSNANIDIVTAHPHTLDLTSAQIEAGVAVTLTMTGAHTHEVSLTAEEVASIAACGTVVTTSSTTSGHSHQVTLAGIA